MKYVKYRSLELLETGTVVESNLPVAWTIVEKHRYTMLTKFGREYQFDNVRNSFSTPEEALKALFEYLHPDLVEVDS